MVGVLSAFEDAQPFEGRFQILALVIEIEVVASECASKWESMYAGVAICFLWNIGVIDKRSGKAIVLQLVIVEESLFGYKSLGYYVGKDSRSSIR